MHCETNKHSWKRSEKCQKGVFPRSHCSWLASLYNRSIDADFDMKETFRTDDIYCASTCTPAHLYSLALLKVCKNSPSTSLNTFVVNFKALFAKLAKSGYLPSLCLSVRLSSWRNSASTRRIFMKFGIWVISRIQLSLSSDKSNGYFTWSCTSMYIYDTFSLSSC